MRQMRLRTEAFEDRCLYTQNIYTETLWHTHAFAHRSFYTQIFFKENHRSFETEKPLHREYFTHRNFYTENCPQKPSFTQRNFYAQELLHTSAFTHRSLYTRRLLHRSSYTEKPYTEQLLHASKSQIYWVFDVRPSCHAKWLHLALENCNFWRWTIILRQRVAPDFGKSQFTQVLFRMTRLCLMFQNGWSRFFTPILERLHLASKKGSFSTVIAVWLSCHACIWTFKITILHHALTVDHHVVPPGLTKSAFCHMFGRPTCRGLPVPKKDHIPLHVGRPTRVISANGCFVQRRVALHHTTCLPIRHGRSPQRVAQGQTRPVFRHMFGRPTHRRG